MAAGTFKAAASAALLLLLASGASSLELAGAGDAAAAGAAGSRGPVFAPFRLDTLGLVDRAAAIASVSAQQAWTAQAKAEKIVEGNLKFLPLAKAEIALAETAAQAAEEQDKLITGLVEETRAATRQEAMQAAMGYLAHVKSAGATGTAGEWAARRSLAERAEVAAAKAASNAAMPYHAMILRGQRVVSDYTQKAQALAAAGINLRAEGQTLASSAEQYQMVGQTSKASQIMITAHSLLNQGNAMTKQAEELTATAKEVHDALPMYQQAEEAAFQSAAQSANPPILYKSPPII